MVAIVNLSSLTAAAPLSTELSSVLVAAAPVLPLRLGPPSLPRKAAWSEAQRSRQ